ncbi:nicotinate-nucleotide diphosphorylase (carboxylating) [Chitinophagaceae bacterium IBVUCB1]|nr:nicotinate-nucleotide diphosphorylase (carboxylating) [Chitinophagaceae bacterium IBVUCB1]
MTSLLTTHEFIAAALREDIGTGDHSTLSSIAPDAMGKAVLKVKEDGILAGVQLAQDIFHFLEPEAVFTIYKQDGDAVKYGDVAFEVSAKVHTILQAERLSLNCMQRMSGIATLTNQYVQKLKSYKTRILDTRKTTPMFRTYEKLAVKIGGGENHRMGLYDMVMLKDNHIDFCGGIAKAIAKTNAYLQANKLDLKIEVETRNIEDVKRVLAVGGIHRIMLDNYTPEQLAEAVKLIDGKYETEASGGITIENIEAYAATGVDFISVGAIIHHATSMDLSLKAQLS